MRTLGTIKNNSIKTNAILNIINAVANTVFPLIIYPYVSRCIGPDGVGKVSFFFSYANYFSLAAALGLSTYGVREVARQKANPDALRKTVSELFTINIVLSALFVSVYVISSFAFDRFNQEPLLIIICAVSIATPPLNMGWFFCGLEQYGHITKINAYIKIVTLVLSFLLINSAEDYWIYALVLAFAPVCSDIYYFFYARKLVKPCFLITRTTLSHLKPLIILFGSTLAVSVYTNLDTVMLGLISGDREVGLYSTAVKVKSILLMAVNAVSIVTLPRLSSYFAEKKMNEYRLVVKNTVSTVLMITIPFIVFFIVQSLNVVVILGGNNFAEASLCLKILMPILLFSGLANISGNQILLPQGKDWCFTLAVSCGAAIDLILNALLMPKYGCNGAALATLVAEFVQMSIQFYFAREFLFCSFDFKCSVKVLSSSFLALIILLIFPGFDAIHAPMLNMFLSACIYFFSYLIILIIFREKLLISFFSDIGGQIMSKTKK